MKLSFFGFFYIKPQKTHHEYFISFLIKKYLADFYAKIAYFYEFEVKYIKNIFCFYLKT